MTVNPQPHGEPGGEDLPGFPALRMVWCAHYGECLSMAVENDWPSFTCRDCGHFEPEQPDSAWIELESERCRALILAVFRNEMDGAGRAERLLKRTEKRLDKAHQKSLAKKRKTG